MVVPSPNPFGFLLTTETKETKNSGEQSAVSCKRQDAIHEEVRKPGTASRSNGFEKIRPEPPVNQDRRSNDSPGQGFAFQGHFPPFLLSWIPYQTSTRNSIREILEPAWLSHGSIISRSKQKHPV